MKNKFNILLVLFILALVSCDKDDVLSGSEISNGIEGNIQKGPFIAGSNVMIQLLNENFIPTGTIYNTITNNDFGGFNIENEIKAPYIEIISTGFYFDEVKGGISDAQISLRTICKVGEAGKTNINILTTLSRDRIVHLVKNEKISYEKAKIQAQNEILSIFNMPDNDRIDFNQLNISQSGDENAILLAISCILQENLTVGQLSEIVSKFILDIKEDGILDDSSIREALSAHTKSLDLSSIRNNLESRYREIGQNAVIPPFEKYAKRLMPLDVIRTYPENGIKFAYGVDEIQLHFNKAIDESTINPENITMTNSSGQTLDCQLSYDNDRFMIVVSPSELANDAEYTIHISQGLKAMDGSHIDSNFSLKFKSLPIELDRGLLAYYPLDENADNALGTGFNASVFNGMFIPNGVQNQAYHIQGVGSYIEIPNVTNLGDSTNLINLGDSNWAHSIWIKFNSWTNSRPRLLHNGYFHPVITEPLTFRNNKEIYAYTNSSSGWVTGNGNASVDIKLNEWNHVVLTTEGTAYRVYFNGTLVISLESEIGKTPFDSYSGSYFMGEKSEWHEYAEEQHNHTHMDGVIDNIRFYNRTLNKKEVLELYQKKQ